MKIRQSNLLEEEWQIVNENEGFQAEACQLVLVFGAKTLLCKPETLWHLRLAYPNANLVLGSTAGEILHDSVYNDTVVASAVQLEKSEVRCVSANISEFKNSFDAGHELISRLAPHQLVGVLVISDGTQVNGSELVAGLNQNKPSHVTVVGGLAADGETFQSTAVGLNDNLKEGNIVAIGFYGDIKIGSGSLGGWDEFGPERMITRSFKNVLYEIDGKNALEAYKSYLGPYADELPGSAFYFPLAISVDGSDKKVVRTILTIDETEQSMTFAGNMPEGNKIRLMKANLTHLIEASSNAAAFSLQGLGTSTPELAILISCVGRKIILKQRIYEEVESAREGLGSGPKLCGFYSYGEISPLNTEGNCELHNQTMTITALSEN